jgi:hypothetical protein
MPKTKTTAKRSKKKQVGAISKKGSASGATPNDLPDAVTASHVRALQVTCQYLGKTFYQGDSICYQSSEWICGVGGWSKTGQTC